MIKENQFINVYISRKNTKEYYENKGYEVQKLNTYIEINAKDISPGSHLKIKYICDYCGEEFERVVYSNERSKKNGNQKDACLKCCRTKRSEESSFKKYGVSNPMKVPIIQQKCQDSNKNFSNGKNYSSIKFEKGIPVSAAQNNLFLLFKDFELNYHYLTYYIDLVKDNIAIEYDGRGHDLGVRLNKITLTDFKKKERIKQEEIMKNFRLLRIIDKKDKLKKEENLKKYSIEEVINDFIKSDELYKEIVIN